VKKPPDARRAARPAPQDGARFAQILRISFCCAQRVTRRRERAYAIETGRAYVETLRNYWLARAEVEQLLAGRLSPGSGTGAERGGALGARAGQVDEH